LDKLFVLGFCYRTGRKLKRSVLSAYHITRKLLNKQVQVIK